MTSTPEFSRLIAIEGITPDKPRTETIEATEEECKALSRRFDLRELSDFKTTLTIRRVKGGTTIQLEGKLEAEVVQACVVTLRDVHGHIEGSFETFFSEDAPAEDAEIDIEFGHDDDSPEMIHNGMIDLGEVAAQYLALELDPYPRAPGVSLAAQLSEAGIEAKNNPFQVLEELKDKK